MTDDRVDVAKVMRLQSMLGAVLDEVRAAPPEEPTSSSAADLTRRAVVEVGSAVPDAELAELGKLVGALDRNLSLGESRVIDAQLIGWLGGLAMQCQWENLRSAVASDQERLLHARDDAALEAKRLARGAL